MALSYTSFAQVDEVGSEKLLMDINGHSLKIPYYSNFELESPNIAIGNAIVVVHGTNRNADTYYSTMQTAAAMRPIYSDSTLIIAPQFLTEADIEFWDLDEEHLYWSNGGWKAGSNSRDEPTNPRPERIPSYAVLDTILLRIALNFPNLHSIVFTGHSAGGQVANRYAASSPIVEFLCEQYQISTRFVVANPSSYVYLDAERRVDGTVDQFEEPITNCTDYNDWKYGLVDLYTYLSNIGVDSIRSWMPKRQVVYLLGENDNNPNSATLDFNCAAMLQGAHRLERGSIYFNYLQNYYGTDILDFQSIDTVPGVGHSHFDMYTSEMGLYHLFESPPIACEGTTTNTGSKTLKTTFQAYPNPTAGRLTLSLPSADALIRLFRMDGIVVVEFKTGRVTHFSLELSQLSDGLYILQCQTADYALSKLIVKASSH